MSPALTHIAVQVRDLAACARFYADDCGMRPNHARADADGPPRVIWMAEPGKEDDFILARLAGCGAPRREDDCGHLDFALEGRAAVDAVAARARTASWSGRRARCPTPSATTVGSAIPTAASSRSAAVSRSGLARPAASPR